MKKLTIKKAVKRRVVQMGGCGRNWTEVCGTRN